MGSQQAEVENVSAQAFKLLVSYQQPDPETTGIPAGAEGN